MPTILNKWCPFQLFDSLGKQCPWKEAISIPLPFAILVNGHLAVLTVIIRVIFYVICLGVDKLQFSAALRREKIKLTKIEPVHNLFDVRPWFINNGRSMPGRDKYSSID